MPGDDLEQTRRSQIGAFFAGLSAGAFPSDLFAPHACFWNTASGAVDPALYRRVPAMLASIFAGGLAFELVSVIVDGDRAAVEARSHGTYDGDQTYANDYGFFFRFEGEQIVAVAEHLNPLRVAPSLGARMQELLEG